MSVTNEIKRIIFLFISTFIIAFLTNPAVILLENSSAFALTPAHIYAALLVASNAIWNFQVGTLVFFGEFNPFIFLLGLLMTATFIFLERTERKKPRAFK
jgi:hypothetical protein